MVKVKCIICGLEGFTASPKFIICSCGGRFKEITGHHSKLETFTKTIEYIIKK